QNLVDRSNEQDPTGLEVRVLTGPLQGASRKLPDMSPVSFGFGLRNEVVLRTPDWKSTKIKLHRQAAGSKVDILTGKIEAMGQCLEAPGSVHLPDYVPLRVGDTQIAIGTSDPLGWQRCEAFAQESLSLANGDMEDSAAHTKPERGNAHRSPSRKRLVVGLTLLGILALGLIIWSIISLRPSDGVDPFDTAAAILSDAEYSQLQLATSVEGTPQISGFLETDADFARLSNALETAGIDTKLMIQTGDALANRTSELASELGLDVSVQGLGGQDFKVSGVMTVEQAETLGKILASDLGDLANIEIAIDAFPEPDPLPHSSRSGDRIVSITRFGDGRGVIVTDDGRHIYRGGILPNGFRVSGFMPDGLHLERDGYKMIQDYQ
ncbi:MAG: hypothetical protein AAGJ50_14170, partial [Pseudomonadota bacterium]